MIKTFLFTTAGALRSYIDDNPDQKIGCVETEYGSEQVISPSGPTLNHHEVAVRDNDGQDLPVPCTVDNFAIDLDVIAISHMDLDTVGGIMALNGTKPHDPLFWAAAAFVDMNGPHRIEGSAHEDEHLQLAAYWAAAPRVDSPADGVDLTSLVEETADLVSRICDHDPSTIEGGVVYLQQQADAAVELERSSLVAMVGKVTLRSADVFVNTIYDRSDIVVGYNTVSGAITLSFKEVRDGISAADLLQDYFGPGAGGHAGIGGTDREKRYSLVAARCFAEYVTCNC